MSHSTNATSYQSSTPGEYEAVPSSEDPSKVPKNRKGLWTAALGLTAVAVIGILVWYLGKDSQAVQTEKNVQAIAQHIKDSSPVQVKEDGSLALFDNQNRYVLEDFDAKSTFTSFLPGVAGYFGKPVWAFYVNRGQAVATFGTESRDYPILEFNPANKAYQSTSTLGFRTFIKGKRPGLSFEIEPFASETSRSMTDEVELNNAKPKRILFVGTNELEIQEIDGLHGLGTNVQYFVMPDENFASLVRRTTFTNLGQDILTFEGLDGLARMEPYGGALDWGLKNMGKTLEGWMGVYQAAGDDTLTMPFFKLSTEPTDSANVVIENAGHYCLSFIEVSETDEEPAALLPIVFDTSKIFGKDTSLDKPRGYTSSSVEEILANPQYGWAKTSSAFAALENIVLQPGQNITIASMFGKANDIGSVATLAARITAPGFIAGKLQRARSLANELTAGVDTTTVNPLFDGTVKQMFLDNGLRGGYPTIMGNVQADTTYDEDPTVKVFHSFSRIHGDLERDYNAFKIVPTFYSQGPGNYRDIAQNRRNDVVFYPRMGSFDIQIFLSYIQADAYEPLTVESVAFVFPDPQKADDVAELVTNDLVSSRVLGAILKGGPFRPGQLFELCDQLKINLSVSREDFIDSILEVAEDRAMAVYGQGYWADHWTYYIDMIDAYLGIFPDGEEALMYDKPLRYFFSPATVKPRSQKYILTLTYDGQSKHVQQLDATFYDPQKAAEQEAFRNQNTGLVGVEANWQRTNDGATFMSSAIAKLMVLGTVKYAMRDAWGCGVEYEGGRPGWLDSMNGLPGMVGSGMPETYELLLLLKYIRKVVGTYKRPVLVPWELSKLIESINEALEMLLAANVAEPTAEDFEQDIPDPLFRYWDVVTAARENYRNDVQYYFAGNTTSYSARKLVTMLDKWINQINLGIERSFKIATVGYGDDGTSGIPATFFAFEVTKWELNENKSPVGLPCVNALSMKVKKFPLFLEGPVRYMKTIEDNPDRMVDIYNRVKTSGLRDTILDMYFLSASLKGQTYDMGRQIAFAPGWLENQSIWMHMSYKYYLQLIRGKLYDEFFSEMRGGGILPFMDPDVYGRSLMECSSFIASSAFPDPSIVGEGFLPRLSGSTAEFMDMWKLMFIGPQLFSLDSNGALTMTFLPALPSWLFQDDEGLTPPTFDEVGNHVVQFKLFASIPVTYHNEGGKNLYGVPPKKYVVTFKDDGPVEVQGPSLNADLAAKVRRMTTVVSLDAFF